MKERRKQIGGRRTGTHMRIGFSILGSHVCGVRFIINQHLVIQSKLMFKVNPI